MLKIDSYGYAEVLKKALETEQTPEPGYSPLHLGCPASSTLPHQAVPQDYEVAKPQEYEVPVQIRSSPFSTLPPLKSSSSSSSSSSATAAAGLKHAASAPATPRTPLLRQSAFTSSPTKEQPPCIMHILPGVDRHSPVETRDSVESGPNYHLAYRLSNTSTIVMEGNRESIVVGSPTEVSSSIKVEVGDPLQLAHHETEEQKLKKSSVTRDSEKILRICRRKKIYAVDNHSRRKKRVYKVDNRCRTKSYPDSEQNQQMVEQAARKMRAQTMCLISLNEESQAVV